MKTALLIEPYSPDTYAFIDGLHDVTHCRVRHDQTIEDGLKTMEQTYCDLVLVTIAPQSSGALKVVEQIRSRASDLLVRPPEVILLFNKALPIPEALRCRDLGAMSMRRDVPQAIYEETRLAFWKRATRKHEVTVRVDYRNGHHLLYVGTPPVPVDLGAQLLRLAVLLLSGNESYTVEYLADELGVCRQSVKKYFLDLRRAFVRAHAQCEIGSRSGEIFWMEKRSGGTVCGMRANPIWN